MASHSKRAFIVRRDSPSFASYCSYSSYKVENTKTNSERHHSGDKSQHTTTYYLKYKSGLVRPQQ